MSKKSNKKKRKVPIMTKVGCINVELLVINKRVELNHLMYVKLMFYALRMVCSLGCKEKERK